MLLAGITVQTERR